MNVYSEDDMRTAVMNLLPLEPGEVYTVTASNGALQGLTRFDYPGKMETPSIP